VAADQDLRARVTVVLLTFNCAHRLGPILERLLSLDVDLVAVDNASSDGTVAALRARPGLEVIALAENIGAAARNVGLRQAATPYVAFCDDDGWYERDGLARAVEALEDYPELALVNARILVGEQDRLDPISAEMALSPLAETRGIPGTVLLGFMAGACVVRVAAYLAVGGYDREFFMGGEEQALAYKLVHAGWQLRYQPEVVMHHLPSQANVEQLRAFGMRNALWTCWLFRRPASALSGTLRLALERPKDRDWVVGVGMALRGLPWVLRRRRPLPADLDRQLVALDRHRRSLAHTHRAHARQGATSGAGR
jgi:GT2 family glycosyltransferase